jgi:transposase
MDECPTRLERVGHMPDTKLLPKSKAETEPARRVEVFTGAGRRRAWSAEQKRQIVADSFESGESVSGVARRYGLTPQQLFGWRRSARWAPQDRGSVFAPVVVDAASPISRGGAVIEIVLGAAAVRVAPGADAATLVIVLRALKSVP